MGNIIVSLFWLLIGAVAFILLLVLLALLFILFCRASVYIACVLVPMWLAGLIAFFRRVVRRD